jgi:hypothetical protein
MEEFDGIAFELVGVGAIRLQCKNVFMVKVNGP